MERIFKHIVDTIREPLLVLDDGLNVALANRAFYETFKVSMEETERRHISALGNGQWNIPALIELLTDILPNQSSFNDLEVTHDFPELGNRTMVLNARQIIEEDAMPMILLAIDDITERRRTERQIQELATKLARSNQELQDFAQVASHDLQEPLRKIQAFGDRVRRSAGATLQPEAEEYLQRMLHAAARMQALINDLLAFSRLETTPFTFKKTSLQTILVEVIADLEARIQQTRGTVTVVDVLPTIYADPLAMRQLFQNILGNALKYHKPGTTPRVVVRARLIEHRRAGESQLCEIAIEDNGIGFDEKYLDRIFTIFQRLHGKNEYEGTGIGLALCRKIVQRHGGSITAHSAPGQGATFIVRLPATQDSGHTPYS